MLCSCLEFTFTVIADSKRSNHRCSLPVHIGRCKRIRNFHTCFYHFFIDRHPISKEYNRTSITVQFLNQFFYRKCHLLFHHLKFRFFKSFPAVFSLYESIKTRIYLLSSCIHDRADYICASINIISQCIHSRYMDQRFIQCQSKSFCCCRSDPQSCK